MPGRRLLLIAAVLMGLTALAASLSPEQARLRDRAANREAPAPPPAAGTERPTIEETVSGDGRPERVVVTEGDLVLLLVQSSALDSVVLEGLDMVEPVEPDSPARFNLLAEAPGRYPIVLLDGKRRIGTFVVRPAGAPGTAAGSPTG